MMKDVDRAREAYRQKYCEGENSAFDHRDICIDSGRFGASRTSKLLCGIVRELFI